MSVRDVVQAAAGVGGDKLYVDDVFSTYLYTGTGSAQTITNGIDLAGEGGLVWEKSRSVGSSHGWIDTVRGTSSALSSNNTGAQNTVVSSNITAFNSNGYTINSGGDFNTNGAIYASWSWRKAPKFFDIVTWTGDGTTNGGSVPSSGAVFAREITHSLGSAPGFVVVKSVSSTGNWKACHRKDGVTQQLLALNSAEGNQNTQSLSGGFCAIQHADAANKFYLFPYSGSVAEVNASGVTYVAYVFAHNAGGFGDDGEQDVISCGSYTGNGSATGPEINLGWEPQWLLIKRVSGGNSYWGINDNMRGIATGGTDAMLHPNGTDAEYQQNVIDLTATGFIPQANQSNTNASGSTYIYIAIRRPMKPPESGTEVFHPTFSINPGSPAFVSPFPVDFVIHKDSTGGQPRWSQRLAPTRLQSSSTAGETTTVEESFSFQNGQYAPIDYGSPPGAIGSTSHMAWMFARRPGFMDVVAFTQVGTGSVQTINHNLTVVPELIIFKTRGGGDNWRVRVGSYSGGGILNSNSGFSSSLYATNLTSTTFGFNQGTAGYSSGMTFVSYLFATLAGVSKVGSYTGTGADLNVDCGFSAGARFILIKRTDSTGDWYVWDSVRGIAAGNDPYLLLNTTAAQVTNTDYIDPLASGFTVTSSAPAALNASGGSYIFLAIA